MTGRNHGASRLAVIFIAATGLFPHAARAAVQRTVEPAEGFQSEIFRGLALVAAADAALRKSKDAGGKSPAAGALSRNQFTTPLQTAPAAKVL